MIAIESMRINIGRIASQDNSGTWVGVGMTAGVEEGEGVGIDVWFKAVEFWL